MDEKTTREYIDEQVIYLTQKLSDLKPGSEEHSALVQDIERLQKLNLKDSEIDTSWDTNTKEHELKEKELELKEKELESNRRFRWVEFAGGTAVGVLAIAVPAIVYSHLTDEVLEFEETGSIGSKAANSVLNMISSFGRTGM